MDASDLTLVDGRYALVAPLGRGRTGTTWRARRLADGQAVALKERPLPRWGSFRELDRCQREAELLASLSHARIPRLVEGFLVEDGPRTAFYVAVELVEGAPLSAELSGPRRTLRAALLDLAALLDVLAYLHGLSPAVVHADLSPDNVVRRARDGALFLVDFHAARSHPEARPAGLTTAVGTPGFLAPEQLAGRAEPKTDLYAAACVALALLTRRPVHELVDERGRLAWRSAIAVPRDVQALFARMLEPDLARRAGSASKLAAEARALARGERSSSRRPLVAVGVAAAALAAWALYPGAAWAPEARGAADAADAADAAGATGATEHASVATAPTPRPSSPELEPPLRFPDLPGSACAERGDCLSLGDGALFEPVKTACAEAASGVEEPHFTLVVAGMTPFCQAREVRGTCIASCALRFRHMSSEALQQRAEDVAQAVRDLYGRSSGSPWRQFALPEGDTSLVRKWLWQHSMTRIEVTADWRPIPATSDAPTDIHVTFFLPRLPRPAPLAANG